MSSLPWLALRGEILHLMSDELKLAVESTETDLIVSGVIDSLALADLVSALEARYGVEIILGELDLEVFRTVTTIAIFISQLLQESTPLRAIG
jgi:acyl carrier protein